MKIRILILGLMQGLMLGTNAQTLSHPVLAGFVSHSQAGNAYLSSTMGQPFAGKLTSGNSILTTGFEQPEIEIITDTVTAISFNPADTLTIPFTAFGFVDGSNIFTAQLSDSAGNFANPVALGSGSGTASGTIKATVPAGLSGIMNYRIRVVSSNPNYAGKPNKAYRFLTFLSVVSTRQDDFSIYPNPATDFIYFTPLKSMIGKITMRDMNGKVIYESPIKGEQNLMLDLGFLSSGVYLITYQDAEGVVSKSIVKQ